MPAGGSEVPTFLSYWLEKRLSKSRPDAGLVRIKHTGRNQDGVVVVELERTAMFLKRPAEN